MSREFDQSTFELGLHGISSPLYFTPEGVQGVPSPLYLTPGYLSDLSEADIDPGFFLSNGLTKSPLNHQPNLRTSHNRTKTPRRINKNISSLFNFHNV